MTGAQGGPALPGDRERRLDAVERRIDTLVDRVSPYAGLVLGAVLTPPFLADGPVWAWVTVGVLVPVTAVWCALLVSVRPVKAERPAVGAVYIVGLLVLMTPLVYASPLFAFQAIAVYMHSFAYLRGRWRFAAVAAGAVLVSYSQVGGRFAEFTPGLGVAMAVLVVANSLFGGGATYFGVFISEQSQRRRQIIEELNESNRRLSETLEENAALHAQLLAQAREAGITDERARLAREIHDTIAQGLTGIVTQLEAAGAANGDAGVRRRTSTPRGHWPGRASPRPVARSTRSARASSPRPSCPTRSPTWRSGGPRPPTSS